MTKGRVYYSDGKDKTRIWGEPVLMMLIGPFALFVLLGISHLIRHGGF